MKPRAVVLLSGGLDSATVLAMAREVFEPHCLTVSYGQRHAVEMQAAKRVAAALGAREQKIVGVDLAVIGGVCPHRLSNADLQRRIRDS